MSDVHPINSYLTLAIPILFPDFPIVFKPVVYWMLVAPDFQNSRRTDIQGVSGPLNLKWGNRPVAFGDSSIAGDSSTAVDSSIAVDISIAGD